MKKEKEKVLYEVEFPPNEDDSIDWEHPIKNDVGKLDTASPLQGE